MGQLMLRTIVECLLRVGRSLINQRQLVRFNK